MLEVTENGPLVFFVCFIFNLKKNFFYPKHLNKPINGLKNQKQPQAKNIRMVRSIFSRKEKEIKHLGKTILIKWNSLISISIFLMSEIIIYDYFLFLCQNLISSLSPLTKINN